jgi:hypothetical protein
MGAHSLPSCPASVGSAIIPTLQQVNNEIQSLESQATMLINQARNLASLPYSALAQLEAQIQRTEQLLQQAQRIAYGVTQINQAFTTTYPQSYPLSTSAQQLVTDAQTRWQNALGGFQDAMTAQAGAGQNLDTTRTQITALVSNSQSATGALTAIDITLAGLFWAMAPDEDVIARLVRKTLYIGLFAFIIGNFNNLAQIVCNPFAGLGLEAGGGTLSRAQLLQPGRLAQIGITAGQPILAAISSLTGFVAFFENFIQIAILLLAWLIVVISFFVMAIQLFVSLLEFKLTMLAGFVLVPFGLFGRTAFPAEKPAPLPSKGERKSRSI